MVRKDHPNGKVTFFKTKAKATTFLKSEKRKGKMASFVANKKFFGKTFFGVASY